MNHFLTRADHVIKNLEKGSALIAGLITMLVMFLMVIDIVLRNLFNVSLISVYEFVTYSFVGVVALGFAYVQGQKNNVIVEIATQSFPNLYKKHIRPIRKCHWISSHRDYCLAKYPSNNCFIYTKGVWKWVNSNPLMACKISINCWAIIVEYPTSL